MMTVFIAEKPDIAAAMAEYIWEDPKKAHKLQTHYIGKSSFGDETVVTWAYGHILMQAMPEKYGKQYKSFDAYPVIPEKWIKEPSPSAAKQLEAIQMLIKNADVVVNGGDPDREGQLLVDEILEYCGYKGKVKRILINAKDNESLKRAFSDIRENSEFRSLYLAGLARERADWLVGMNLSRAYSMSARKHGMQATWRIGRVKVPTLSLVVAREREIENFRAVKHFLLTGNYISQGIKFTATLVPGEETPADSEGRILDKRWVEERAAELQGKTAVVTKCEKKQGIENAPLPYSLDTLQTEANKRFGFSPKTVLQTVQNLYEKKLVSYPRSDCNYIPTSQHEDAKRILTILGRMDKEYSPFAQGADCTRRGKAFDDSKISAHHAIIPTGVAATYDYHLSDIETVIYNMIAVRYIIQFYPPCQYNQVKYEITARGMVFAGQGKAITEKGWRTIVVQSDGEKTEEQKALPSIEKGQQLQGVAYTIEEKVTTPPKRFTEGTLLAAMTNIWRFVSPDNPNRDRLKECKGLGTPATRDTIISELMEAKGTVKACIEKDGKELVPTTFGCYLIDHIDETLTKPDFTAEMEYNLSAIAVGKKGLEEYMKETESLVTRNIEHAEKNDYSGAEGVTMEVLPKVHRCPVCGKETLVRRMQKVTRKPFWVCQDIECHHPVTGKTMFYEDYRNKPKIGLCPDCGTVMNHIFSQKTKKYYWHCSKCNGFKNDAKKYQG